MPSLYVVSRNFEHDPYLTWIDEAWAVVTSDHSECAGWTLHPVIKADSRCSFNPLDVYSIVARSIGPILFVGGLQSGPIHFLEEKLGDRVVTRQCNAPTSSTDVYETILELLRRHEFGEPEVPCRYAVALMLLRKLDRMHYWGGKAKNFMSVHILAKGNGLDESYATTAHEVAEYLSSDKRRLRLLAKKTGDGYPKYGCNPEQREAVYEFLRNRKVDDEEIMRWLKRDPCKVSARDLDLIVAEDYEPQR